MPDEPTRDAGPGGGPPATFRPGVERAEAPAPSPPATSATSAATTSTPGPTPADTGTSATGSARSAGPTGSGARSPKKVRARKVRRIVRHIEPWSVLKISLLFYAALFVIICVASAILWNAARGTGAVDDIESFITEVGGFGTCELVDGAATDTTTTTVADPAAGPVDQFDPTGTETTVAPGAEVVDEPPEDEEDCREGERLVGEFKFEDGKIFQAFLLGGIVLVLAGSATNVVLTLLFNLMSDLTGGVRVTVLEEDPAARPRRSGSPASGRRG